ncbi:MAG: argininosuccinate lyase [Clostridiales bacterium]|jgi:argininosuccinate lyase|nr:argininosuccinate lyase [Clostridiales bacterium]
MDKLWGGRFKKTTSAETDHFHSSISFDCRLYEQDIAGSIAHAKMLGRQGIIPQTDADKIIGGLNDILDEIRAGNVEFDLSAEDIHMNIESLLIQRIGESGKKHHTGRSRNDQVALDMRIYVREEIENINNLLFELLSVINTLAKKHIDTVMPGYTHLQRAQPITLAFHLLAYSEMFMRDIDRMTDVSNRADAMPLGSGALAGSTYPLDRDMVKELLGFDALTLNALDAVSDRDFCVEFLSSSAIIMMHLSRFCEEIILWSSKEFDFIELDDAYSTGSSIMPQKKNPDMAELIRGKTGRVYGDLICLLTVMKSLPLAYNKDMQEDKESIFDAVDTIKSCLIVFKGMLDTMTVHENVMRSACNDGFVNATDAADWLVKKGLPFRDAHEIIGRLVLYCIAEKKTLETLTLDEWQDVSPEFDSSIYEAIVPETCVNARNLPGGPGRDYLLKLIALNQDYLSENVTES